MASYKRELKLDKLQDWDLWISTVQDKAEGLDIWDLINPSKDTKPDHRTKPEEPELDDDVDADAATQAAAVNLYNARYKAYKASAAKWKEQRDALYKINEFIQETLTLQNQVFIQYEERHP